MKGKAKKATFTKYFKSSPILAPRMSVRSVMTYDETEELKDQEVPHITDLRGFDKSVEFLIGVPESQLHRKVVIYKPTPRTTQQGSKHTLVYMKFQRQNARVNESLMGWTATSDPTGNLTLSFPDDTTAIAFAQRNGLDYELNFHEGQDKIRVPRDYGNNFKYRDPKKQHQEDFDL